MNERIKEISKQAWEWAEQQEYKDPGQEFSDILEGKFAELIIAECASLCEARAWGMIEKGFPGHEAVEECSDIIKQHFGVTV